MGSLIISLLTMNATAQHRMDANVALGIYPKNGVNRLRASRMIIPVYSPEKGVLTPLAWLTADRVNAPHVGIDLKKAPKKLHSPSANISCVASSIFPVAKMRVLAANLIP